MILSDLQNKTLSAVWNQFHGNVAVCCAILSQFPCNITNITFRIQRNLVPVLNFLVSHTKHRRYIHTTCPHTVTNPSAFMNVDSHVFVFRNYWVLNSLKWFRSVEKYFEKIILVNTYCRLKWILSILQVQTFEDGPVRLKTVNNFLSERSDSKNTPILIYAPGFQNIRTRMVIEILSRNHWSLKWEDYCFVSNTENALDGIWAWTYFLRAGDFPGWIGSILFWSKNSVVSFPFYFLRDLGKFNDRWFSKQ